MGPNETTAHGENEREPRSESQHKAAGFSSAADGFATDSQFRVIDHEDLPDPPPDQAQGVNKLKRRLRNRKVALITTASYSPAANRRKRERHYMWIQGMRIPFLLLSGLTYLFWENMWLSAILFVISVPLPWIAVVIANGIGEPRDPRAPAVYKPALARSTQPPATELPQASNQLALPPPNSPTDDS